MRRSKKDRNTFGKYDQFIVVDEFFFSIYTIVIKGL